MQTIVNIDVPELAPAIKFYSEALELHLNRILDKDVAELSGGACMIYLVENAECSSAVSHEKIVRRYTRHWTPVHIDFVVDNLIEAAERAVKAGAIRESERVEWRGSRCITFSDPFGNGFCLIEFDQDTYNDSST